MLVRSQVTSGGLHLPSSAQLRAAGGVYCTYCSLYILIMFTYRVAMAQEKQLRILLLCGVLACKTVSILGDGHQSTSRDYHMICGFLL
jgi:hypothetical protein